MGLLRLRQWGMVPSRVTVDMAAINQSSRAATDSERVDIIMYHSMSTMLPIPLPNRLGAWALTAASCPPRRLAMVVTRA